MVTKPFACPEVCGFFQADGPRETDADMRKPTSAPANLFTRVLLSSVLRHHVVHRRLQLVRIPLAIQENYPWIHIAGHGHPKTVPFRLARRTGWIARYRNHRRQPE